MTEPMRLDRLGWIPREQRYDHPERRRMRVSPARFKWCAGGRRSGKTIDAIDHVILGHGPLDKWGLPKWRGALTVDAIVEDPTFIIAAPTYGMLARIWWDKIRRRVPLSLVDSVKSSEPMTIRYKNGAMVQLIGMDNPTRAEGTPCDGLVFDEFAYSKPGAWKNSLRPSLSTAGRPPGWAILQGKPAGRNHFYTGWKMASEGRLRSHDAFHWKSSVVLSPMELSQAQMDLDPRSYREQYEASFETFSGLVYYNFGEHNNTMREWDPHRPLAFAWDFGTHPGTACVCQMHDVPATHCGNCGEIRPPAIPELENWLCPLCREVTYAFMPVVVVIDECYLITGATTPALCDIFIAKYAHKVKPGTPVHLYGDPAGFSGNTQQRSSDWEVIERKLGRHFPIVMNVGRAQPDQRDRVNATLSAIQGTTGLSRLFVNKATAPRTWEDFENTVLKEDGSGQIDKKAAGGIYSHCSDAIGYLCMDVFPRIRGAVDSTVVGT